VKTRQKIRKGIILFFFFLFPAIFYYLSPVLIVEASLKGIINGSFILFSLMFINALFLGDKRVAGGDIIKWILWVPWVGAIVLSAVRSGGYHQIDFFYQTTYGLSIGDVQSLVIYFVVLMLLMVLPAFVFGKRSFCHYLCWMAPFMILGRKIRNFFQWDSLQLKPAPEACKHCHACTENCPMSLPVEEMVNHSRMEHAECILCGTCVDGCSEGVIIYSWRK